MTKMYVKMLCFMNALKSKKGQGMVEYGLIIGLIAVGVIIILTTMGGKLQGLFTTVSNALPGAAPAP